ncbi:hypothetical protein TrST_g11224 [Triparma strigata]|uniref:Uncharacterized protein n=1 Tax=Triparma strigata TaxID=1606541 RepID=A0A9W7EML2_9STRA|nr:hypothetical protein TrST_g11224 [Triparma strigata]
MNVVRFPNREHSDDDNDPVSLSKPLFLVSRLTLPPSNPLNPPSNLPAHEEIDKPETKAPEYASPQTRMLLVDPSTETLSLVHPSLSFFTFVNKLENVSSVSRGIVEDRVVVRVLFWGACPALYISPRNEKETGAILNLLKGNLDSEIDRQPDRFRAEKAELCAPDANKGVKMETYESLTLELGESTISIYDSDSSGQPISFWGYDQMGLLSNDTDSKVRLHFDDGKSLIFSVSDVEKKKDLQNLIMGRASLPSLLSGGGERILQNNNYDKGVDLDSIIAEREFQALSDEPYDFSASAPAPSSKVVNELDRWSNVVKTVNHIPSPSATAISTFEGPLCTCVKYDDKLGDGSLVVEFEGETNTRNTPTNTAIWKQLYFQVVMEPEEPTDEETKVNNPNVLLPSLHAFSSSHKRRVLFKIPLSNGCVVAGGKFNTAGMIIPKKFPFGFGVVTPQGTVVFGCSDSKAVSQWTSELTKCLTKDLRHYLTAYDASLLTSHLYSVISKDSCVGVLGDVALQIKVHVSKGSSNNSVEVDVLSSGVGRVVTDVGDEKKGRASSPKRPKNKRGSAKWNQVKGALGTGALRARPKSPKKKSPITEEVDDGGSTASGSTAKSNPAPPTHPKRKQSRKPSGGAGNVAHETHKHHSGPPPTPPRSVKGSEISDETKSAVLAPDPQKQSLDQRVGVKLHPASGSPPSAFSSGIPPPPSTLDPPESRSATPQTTNLTPAPTSTSPPSPDEPAKTFYRRLSKGSLSPSVLAAAVASTSITPQQPPEKVNLNNWMTLNSSSPYYVSIKSSSTDCVLTWSTSESSPPIGTTSLLKSTFDIIDVPEITISFEDGVDVLDDVVLKPEERVLGGKEEEEWCEE